MWKYGVYRLVSEYNNTIMIWDNIAHIIVSVLISVFFSLYVNKAGIFVDQIINSCENGAPLVNDVCDCSDLPFGGKNCQTSTCVNGFAVYDLNSNSHTMNRLDSLWACYCKGKWSGYNCEICNADLEDTDCSGPCKKGYYGAHCQNTCFANLTQDTRYLSSLPEGVNCKQSEENGGVCSYCSKQGTCDDTGACKCNAGHFDYKSGDEVRGCELTCPKNNGTFCSGHGECQSTGLVVNCNCQLGYTGTACQHACINECSGIGTCVVSDVGTDAYCSCPDRTRGEYCQHLCPGKSICSGRGTCDATGKCTCVDDWKGDACDCQNSTTCGGHGFCQPSGECVCDENWDCTVNRCLRDWYGTNCETSCTATANCNGHGACDQNGACKCDLGWVGKHCDDCAADVFPKPGGTDDPCTLYITKKTCHNHGNPNYLYKKSSRFPGMCICDTNFDDGSNCDRCTVNWYGDNCDKFCTGEQCYRGRCSDQGTCICEDGWFGDNCDSSCGGEVICSGHGACVVDRWTKVHQKCQCEEGYSGVDCDISAPMSSGSICNGRGAAVVSEIEHTGITFDCHRDADCGNFAVFPPDFTESTLSVAFQAAITQAVWGVIGPEDPYGPMCNTLKPPVTLAGVSGSVGEHAMTEWNPDDITDGPFYAYISESEKFVYPLFRTKRTGYREHDADGDVTLYGDFVRENSVECEHFISEAQAILAGCTWLDSDFCKYAMQGVDVSDWCYRKHQFTQNKCANVTTLECHVDNCSVPCYQYSDRAQAINQWNSKHMNTPFDGEDLIDNPFTITEDMYWGDMPNYDVTDDCRTVLGWDIPIKVNNTPRWWCQYGDIVHVVDVLKTPSEDCQEIDKTIAGFKGFTVNGVQYDTFKEAVAVLQYPDTIEYGKHHEYAEIMSIDDMCRYYNSSQETWVSDRVGDFNGTYSYLEYSFTLLDFSLGTTVAFVKETVNDTNYLAMKHGRRLQMIGGLDGTNITMGPELELGTKYRIRIDFGETVNCTDIVGISCPSSVGVAGKLAGMRAVEAVKGGTHLFAMHAYHELYVNNTSKTNSWRLRLPPGWKATRSIWNLCRERDGVLVRSRALCEEQERLYRNPQSNLTRQQTLDCVERLDSCPSHKLDKVCNEWRDLGRPDPSTCDDPGSNPTTYAKCSSTEWDDWCDNLKNDKLPGKCTVMQCECNMDTYLGIAGSACQLTCPVNSDTGTACGYQEPPKYPYGRCKEIDETNEQQTAPRTVTHSTCECTRSRSESCEEKCDAADTPDCNPKSSKETMRSFDCWGFGSEVSYDHRLSLVSYQRCTEYLQHHPASENPAYNVHRPDVGVGTGLCRWTNTDITWGGTSGNLIDSLVTSEEECKALNSEMGLYSASTGSTVGTKQGSGIVVADGIVMKPIANSTGEKRMYDIVFEGDTSKLDMTKGSKVIVCNQVATVHSSTQVLSTHDISITNCNITYGGATLESFGRPTEDELWRFKSNVIVPLKSNIGSAKVYEISNNYIYTRAKPSGNIKVTVRLVTVSDRVNSAGYILKLPTPVNGLVDGTIPVKLYGNSIYSPKLTNRNNVTIWTGNMFDIVILKVQNVTEVDYGDSAIAVGDKLGESVVVSDNMVIGTPGKQWRIHILKTQIESATLTEEKICRVTCPNCTESVGMLLTQQDTNSTGLIYKKTGTVFHIITTSDWVDDTTDPACNVLTSITVRDPLITKHNAELHQGNTTGHVWDISGNTLVVVGRFDTGECDFFQPPETLSNSVTPISNGWYLMTATASVPVEGVIAQTGRSGTVEIKGTAIQFVSNHAWKDGKAVQGEITTVECIPSSVHLIKIQPVHIVATGTLDGKTILEPLNGTVTELLVVDYNVNNGVHSIIVETETTPVYTGMQVFRYNKITDKVNVGDVARQVTSRLGVVANTDPLEIESSDTFGRESIVFGSPLSFRVTVNPSNDILNTGGKWCSEINGVHVWGKGEKLSQRKERSTSMYDEDELKDIMKHYPGGHYVEQTSKCGADISLADCQEAADGWGRVQKIHVFGNDGAQHYTYNGKNDPNITIASGVEHTFERSTGGHPLMIINETECNRVGCSNGWNKDPESTLATVSNGNPLTWTPTAGIYYYVCTSHSAMYGKITVTTITASGVDEISSDVHPTGCFSDTTGAIRFNNKITTQSCGDQTCVCKLNCSGGCSYNNDRVGMGENIGNDLGALVTSKEECRGYLDYHPAETMLDTGGQICSFNDTHVSWGYDNIGIIMGMPTGTVRLGISECQGGICMCKPPKNAYFYKSRTSVTGKTVKIRQTKYFGRHKGTNFMQGPQQYLINHVKHNNEPITEENWEVKYDIWIVSKSGFVCSNPKYAAVGAPCDSNTICIDAVCVKNTCELNGIDTYVGDYKYEQCLVDSLLLSERQETSAYMGLLCNAECPSITEYGTPCSGHGTCSRTGACTCEVARTMVKYTQNTRKIIKNSDGKPFISFMGQESLKLEERTGWRGDGCELMCPGYDAVEADMTGICSGHGQCTADAKCVCEIGYTGDNCQLDCPNTKKLKIQCSGHGVCQPNTFKATSPIADQLTNWIGKCRSYTEQPLNTVTVNGHYVSQLQFYENLQSESQLYMDAEDQVFNVSNRIVTPAVMSDQSYKYPVRVVGTGIKLVHDRFPRGGDGCESTMVTNQYKIRPQVQITRYNDKQNGEGVPICPEEEEVKQTCDVMSNETLQCAMCACPPTIYNGFWGGSDCRTCMPGYGGNLCKKACPGFDGTDLKTACGGIGTCTWGSTKGKGTVFRTPTCTCGDDPHAAPGYEYCDLYVDGTAISDQTAHETHHFEDKGAEDGATATCSCKNGYSGLLCNKAMPTCLFGGTPQADGCDCGSMVNGNNSANCCPNGLDPTTLGSKLIPSYLTDAMAYTKFSDLNLIANTYAKDCKALCPYTGDSFETLWDHIYNNSQDPTAFKEFKECSGHGTCIGTSCKCNVGFVNPQCSCSVNATHPSIANQVASTVPMNTYTCQTQCNVNGGCICAQGYKKMNEGNCNICPKGSYQDQIDQVNCKVCSAGSVTHIGNLINLEHPGNKAEGSTACKECPKGKFSTESYKPCTGCPEGWWQDADGIPKCKICAAGRYSNTFARTTVCSGCDAGQYQDESGTTSCKGCDAGKYQAETGQTGCKGCAAGKYQDNNGQTECKACLAHSISSVSSSTTCTACLGGKPYANFAKTSCEGCSAGSYPTQTGCTECDSGHISGDNQVECTACSPTEYSSDDHKMCKGCPEGYHSGVGAGSCTACPAGTRGVSTSSTGYPPCVCCDVNTYQASEGKTSCPGKCNTDFKSGCTNCYQLFKACTQASICT